MVVYKTELGAMVVKDKSLALTPRQRSALILCDGKRTREQLMIATAGIGVTHEDIKFLLDLGLVDVGGGFSAGDTQPMSITPPHPPPVPAPAPAAPVAPSFAPTPLERTPQQRYSEAYAIATRLTSGLGMRGFRLKQAVEDAGSYRDLVALLPKIEEAVGAEKCAALEQVLLG